MVEYRIATKDDYEALIDFSNEVFTRSKKEDGTYDYNHNFFQNLVPKLYQNPETAKDHIIAVDNGEIVGCVCGSPLVQNIAGHTVRSMGIGTVGVSHKRRGEGIMKEMMRLIMEKAVEEGYDYSALGGQRQRYNHYGFEHAGHEYKISFEASNTHRIFGEDARFGFKFIELKETDDEYLDAIDKLSREGSAYTVRDRKLLYKWMQTWEFVPYCVLDENDKFAGYFVYYGNEVLSAKFVKGVDVVKVFNDFLPFIKSWSVGINGLAMYEPEMLDAFTSMCEWSRVNSIEMIKIYNYGNMITAFLDLKAQYCPLCDGELTLGFENGEKLKISVNNGKPSVESFDGEPALTLSNVKAVALLFGIATIGTDHGYGLEAAPRSWFPLPFVLEHMDQV